MTILVVLTIASVLAGAVAAVSGFGIGSILTPFLATQVDTRLAVAAVSIPHLTGTMVRFWKLRKQVNRAVLREFGFASALGGLAGALLQTNASAPLLSCVFGGLLVFAGFTGLTGLASRFRITGRGRSIAGMASGFLGGLVGNQGGIRSAAMLGFELSKQAFVATATAIALLVDLARLPVYLATRHQDIADMWPLVLLSTVAVVTGTLAGARLLNVFPERAFRIFVSITILGLGLFMILRAV